MNPTPGASHSPASPTYGFHCVLPKQDFALALARVTEALKADGFGILTEINVQATMKAMRSIDVLPHRILGACNPPLAHPALSAEPDIGLPLPFSVVVLEATDGGVVVGHSAPRPARRA